MPVSLFVIIINHPPLFLGEGVFLHIWNKGTNNQPNNHSFRGKILLNFDFYASRNALHIEGEVRATLAVGVGNNICQRGREVELLTTNKLER